MNDSLTIAVLMVSLILGICTIMGLILRFGLLPWLRENLVKPVEQTNHQVTANHHSSPEPTLPDRLDDIIRAVENSNERFDEHLSWSHEEVGRLWHAIITGRLPDPRRKGDQESL